MTKDFFAQQVSRLRSRWKNNFDSEFVSLLSVQMNTISNDNFLKIVDFFIGNRPNSRPPMLQDFLDERIRQERNEFSQTLRSAIDAFDTPFTEGGLQKFLAKEYPGCKTLNQAVEVQILKNQVERACQVGGEQLNTRQLERTVSKLSFMVGSIP